MTALDLIPRRDHLVALDVAQGSKEWKAERRTRYGGSEIASILGMSPWQSAYELFRQKRGTDPEPEASDLMDMGTVLEAMCAEKFARETGATVYRPVPYLYDRAHPERAVSLDGIAVLSDGRVCVLECKYNSGAPWGDEVPRHYYPQVVWGCELTGLRWAAFGELNSRGKVTPHILSVTDDECRIVTDAVDDFHAHVLSGEPPEAVTDEDRERAALDRMAGRNLVPKMDATGLMLAIEHQLSTLARQESEAKAAAKVLRARVAEEMALAGVLRVDFPDGGRWSLVQSQGRVGWTNLAKDMGISREQQDKYRGAPSVSVRCTHAGMPAEEE